MFDFGQGGLKALACLLEVCKAQIWGLKLEILEQLIASNPNKSPMKAKRM